MHSISLYWLFVALFRDLFVRVQGEIVQSIFRHCFVIICVRSFILIHERTRYVLVILTSYAISEFANRASLSSILVPWTLFRCFLLVASATRKLLVENFAQFHRAGSFLWAKKVSDWILSLNENLFFEISWETTFSVMKFFDRFLRSKNRLFLDKNTR